MKGSGTIMDVSFYPQKFPKDQDFKAPFKSVKGKTYTELRLPEDYSAVILRK